MASARLVITTPALEKLFREEISEQSWEFEGSRVATMLSPKSMKQDVSRRVEQFKFNTQWGPGHGMFRLTDHNCDITRPEICAAIAKATDCMPKYSPAAASYYSFVRYVNSCLAACQTVLPELKQSDYWYNKLRFLGFNKTTQDAITGVDSLIRNKLKAGQVPVLYWSSPTTDQQRDATSDRNKLLRQCASSLSHSRLGTGLQFNVMRAILPVVPPRRAHAEYGPEHIFAQGSVFCL
ncbi:hypothetical protein EUX98_g5874 [Antrodiella citrinella]|uniref:Uncharacterized protein n=1 Tax=Antrodiella citrinella TaxID=2447956 RepID=A0A4S4MY34_9APHY|nr:hypothetical protein EUX98_g5874 [Antrodiella citrinella]